MASPQLERGHTRVANEILEKIVKTNLNGTQFRIVICIWRFTYGFQRKIHEISISQIANYINASKSQIARELEVLIERKIIKVVGIGKRGARILEFNKNYDEWDLKKKKEPSITKKIEKKTVKQSQKKKVYDENNTYYKMALYFYGLVSKVAAEAGVKHLIKKVNLQSWADDFRKLIELDGVDKRQAKEVMDWVTQDDFWKTNVLSARKFREKFVELAIKMNAEKNKGKQKPISTKQIDPRDREIAFQRWIAEGRDPDEFQW